ncbi:hypothetical protein PHYPSEUDO_001002 [Phytophthora pseudosyringae]|uniref:Uncharacterized protein n=1 Tax=Phytophthora pseudosyringae TaxID=221518 RepID=A0A8T1VXC9_9STRA|nr:hypothetical protein PHYPSEUDO_001002 [Phytophthora pseudosyringae]
MSSRPTPRSAADSVDDRETHLSSARRPMLAALDEGVGKDVGGLGYMYRPLAMNAYMYCTAISPVHIIHVHGKINRRGSLTVLAARAGKCALRCRDRVSSATRRRILESVQRCAITVDEWTPAGDLLGVPRGACNLIDAPPELQVRLQAHSACAAGE